MFLPYNYNMHAGIIRGTAMLAGLLWLAACSSSPKSRDYPGYMTRPYTIRGHRYHPHERGTGPGI